MAVVEFHAKGGNFKGHIPRGEPVAKDRAYEVTGEAIEIKGLGRIVKSRPTNVPPETEIKGYGCSAFKCPWSTRIKEGNAAREAFSIHQEEHPESIPTMAMLVKVPDGVYEMLLEKQ